MSSCLVDGWRHFVRLQPRQSVAVHTRLEYHSESGSRESVCSRPVPVRSIVSSDWAPLTSGRRACRRAICGACRPLSTLEARPQCPHSIRSLPPSLFSPFASQDAVRAYVPAGLSGRAGTGLCQDSVPRPCECEGSRCWRRCHVTRSRSLSDRPAGKKLL